MRTDVKWTNLSRRQIARRVTALGTPTSRHVVSQLLRKHGYRRRKALKKKTMGPRHPDRNAQFENIARLKKKYLKAGLPVISIDTKKKELMGDFHRDGHAFDFVGRLAGVPPADDVDGDDVGAGPDGLGDVTFHLAKHAGMGADGCAVDPNLGDFGDGIKAKFEVPIAEILRQSDIMPVPGATGFAPAPSWPRPRRRSRLESRGSAPVGPRRR